MMLLTRYALVRFDLSLTEMAFLHNLGNASQIACLGFGYMQIL